jgi:GNAT superfamily N-acetyltransferase
MAFVIRKAMPDDAPAACAVLRRSIQECCIEDHQNDASILAAWLKDKTPENIRSWFESTRGYAVIAEIDGKVAGTAMLGENDRIALCYLLPEARFIGVGKAMLSALEDEGRKRGLPAIELGSTKTAEAFYRRNGYIETGIDETVFGLTSRGMQKVILQRA